jgi:hypothetical protein
VTGHALIEISRQLRRLQMMRSVALQQMGWRKLTLYEPMLAAGDLRLVSRIYARSGFRDETE